MGLQKKGDSRHAIVALAVIMSSHFAPGGSLCIHIDERSYYIIFNSSLVPVLCIGYLVATHASNFIHLTFPHSVSLKKSGIARFSLTCIKSKPFSIPNATLTNSRNQPPSRSHQY